MRLTQAQIDAAHDLAAVDVEVPEWGGVVGVRPLSMKQQADWAALHAVSTEDASAALLAYSLVDDSGEPLYTVETAAHLEKRSARAVMRLVAKILEVNRLTEESREEVRGNSSAAPTGV